MKRPWLNLIMIGFVGLGVAQCGTKNTYSKNVKLIVTPKIPVVVNADLTLYPGTDYEQKIKAPWFMYGSSVQNNSDHKLYLVTFSFDISGSQYGQLKSATVSIDPSISCLGSTTASRSYLAIIPGGGEYRSVTDGCDPSTISTAAYEYWYLNDLPEADSTYTADVTGEGWFVDSAEIPVERLTLTSSFSTQ